MCMKILLAAPFFLALSLLLLACGSGTSNATSSTEPKTSPAVGVEVEPIGPGDVARISRDDLLDMIAMDSNVLVVDTRSAANYGLEHIKGAVNVSVEDIKSGRWRPPNGVETVIYCG